MAEEKNVLNPVEQAWRKFKNSEYDWMVSESVKLTKDGYCDVRGIGKLPNEILVPIELAATLASQASGKSFHGNYEIADLGQTIACWAAYREAKTIYFVEDCLAECLAKTSWPEKVPVEALNLPSRCPVFAFLHEGETEYVAVFYNFTPDQKLPLDLELRLVVLRGTAWHTMGIISLAGDDLGDCVKGAAKNYEKYSAPFSQKGVPITPAFYKSSEVGLILTLLLYLAGEPDIVKIVHPGVRPDKSEKLKRKEPERWKDIHEPKEYILGQSFRKAIERREIEHSQQALDGPGTGKAIRPHMRRAHAHLYWTGTQRNIPRVKFLLPVSVKGGIILDETVPKEFIVK